MTTFNENISKIDEVIKRLENDLKLSKTILKDIKKNYTTDAKNKTKKNPTEIKKKYGITEPKKLPTNVHNFIDYALVNKKLSDDFLNNNNDIFEDFTTETLVARTKVNSIIHNYIKTNNLYINEDKRSVYKPDNKLKELFEMKDSEELNLKNIQSFLKRAYDKCKSDDNKLKKEDESNEDSEKNIDDEEMENDSD